MNRLIPWVRSLLRHARAAGACAAWVPLVMHPLKDAPTHEMLRAALKEPDPVVRERALEALAFIRDPADAGAVRSMWTADLEATRQQAAKTAAVLGLPASPAQRAAELRVKPVVSAPPASAVATLRSTNLVTWLRGLRALDDAAARQHAAAVLASLARPEVAVQEEAVRAVQRGKIAAAIPELLKRLDDPDEGLRLASADALAAMFEDAPRADLTAAMVRRLELDPSGQVRRMAGLTLVAIHDAPSQGALMRLLRHERGMTRASAALATGAWGDAKLASELHALLEDREDLVARSAASALGQLRNPDSRAPVLAAFESRGPVVQEQAAWALGELKHTNATTVMTAKLTTPHETLKTAIVLALGKAGDKRALPSIRQVLVQITFDINLPRAREAAFTVLTDAGDKLAIPRAIQIVTLPVIPPPPGGGPSFDEPFVRIAALRYLAAVGDRATGNALVAAVKVPLPSEIRPAVAETLGKLLGGSFQPVPDETFRSYFVESVAPREHKPAPPLGVVAVP
ncbi:MAG: HEAT repeat domain-containing protein [Verrucomicrobia bacterium]|nr:HEAT repeat domain-containing protein [Verrucomicrobiota bacterium]